MTTTRRIQSGGEESGGPSAEPAAAGSYGQPPAYGRLPDAARLGPVHLRVSDLGRSTAFYGGVLGLEPADAGAGRVALGAGEGAPIVVLHDGAGAAPRGRRLGLFHTAFLLPDRGALGRFARHLGALGMRYGASNHLVSEALYLADPDGLGVEVYADRPRAAWRRTGRELMIDTVPLDLVDLVRAGGDVPWRGAPAGTVVGHVHLHVGDLADGARFYADGLGFDRMLWSYPGALFLGAGGYHHHLGINTWAGPTARPPGADEPQLLEWTVELPVAEDVAAVARRLGDLGSTASRDADGAVVARDPWGTAVRVRAATQPSAVPSNDHVA